MATLTILELAMDVRTCRGAPPNRESVSIGTRAAVWIAGLAAALVAVVGASGSYVLLAPANYRAEAQVLIGTRAFGLIGLRAHVAPVASADRDAAALAVTKGQAQLVASRDLARRAIEDLGIDKRPEFASDIGGRNPASHLLTLLGLKRDRAGMARPERVLQAYEERLSVSTEPKSRLITIAFESEDRDLAAKAANRIADLYLEMQAATKERMVGVPEARIVSRAVLPTHPVFPQGGWALALGLSVTFASAVGSLVAGQRLWTRRRDPAEKHVTQPLSLNSTRRLVRFEDDVPASPPPTVKVMGPSVADGVRAVAVVAQQISSARPEAFGKIVLVTSCTETRETARVTLELARRLGQDMRAILVGLDKHQRFDFGLLEGHDNLAPAHDRSGSARMTDLFANRVSFTEVIRRDSGSRLHYVAAELEGRLDLTGSESVFTALAETYDFVILVAPPLDGDNAALTLAATADFVVLAAPPYPSDAAMRGAEAALIDRGARNIQIMGSPSRLRRRVTSSLGRDAA
jgi:hypothetical protein